MNELVERECERFLYHEAELLDRRKFHEWLALLSADIDYRVPVRTTREKRDGEGFSNKAFFLKEDFGTLRLRVVRLDSDYAWAENPPSRTRRLVTNIRLAPAEAADQAVVSNLAVYVFRAEAPAPMVLTGERQDVLTRTDEGWKLKTRLVLLDTTILGLESLSIFL